MKKSEKMKQELSFINRKRLLYYLITIILLEIILTVLSFSGHTVIPSGDVSVFLIIFILLFLLFYKFYKLLPGFFDIIIPLIVLITRIHILINSGRSVFGLIAYLFYLILTFPVILSRWKTAVVFILTQIIFIAGSLIFRDESRLIIGVSSIFSLTCIFFSILLYNDFIIKKESELLLKIKNNSLNEVTTDLEIALQNEKNQMMQYRRIIKLQDFLIKLNHMIAENLSLKEYLDFILSGIIEIIPAANLAAALVLNENNYLTVESWINYDDNIMNNLKIPYDDVFAKNKGVVETEKPTIINDLNYSGSGPIVMSSISTPVIKEGKLFGFVNFDSTENNVFTENDTEIMSVVRDQLQIIFEKLDLYKNLNYLSKFDQLTGFYNRWYLYEFGESEKLNLISSLCLVVFDLDHLKQVNDIFGHDKGDEYIKTFVSVMNSHFRKSDIFIRMGGDEFIGIFYDIPQDILVSNLSRAHREFESVIKSMNDYDFLTGFSYGIACRDKNISIYEMQKQADKNMYKMKTLRKEKYVS